MNWSEMGVGGKRIVGGNCSIFLKGCMEKQRRLIGDLLQINDLAFKTVITGVKVNLPGKCLSVGEAWEPNGYPGSKSPKVILTRRHFEIETLVST